MLLRKLYFNEAAVQLEKFILGCRVCVVLGVPGVLALAQELVHRDAAGPQVHLLVVHVLDGLLWRHIGKCASL